MTALSQAIARSRAAIARTAGVPWRILPRVKIGDERPVEDPARQPFDIVGHLFAADKVDARVAELNAFETGRLPGIVGDVLALTVWDNPTGGVIRQHDVVMEIAAGATHLRMFRVSAPPGGDASGHVRLDLTALPRSVVAP